MLPGPFSLLGVGGSTEEMGQGGTGGEQEVVMGTREQGLGCWRTWLERKEIIQRQTYPKPPFISRQGSGFRRIIWVFRSSYFFFFFIHMQI